MAAAYFFNATESKKTFGVGKVYRLYQPVFIAINNRTTDTYTFRRESMKPASVSAEDVAKECKFSTAWRAGTYGVMGLFLLPLIIPAIVDGIGSAQANKEMKTDYLLKEIPNGEIDPGAALFGVAFVERKNYDGTLTISLKDVNRTDEKFYRFGE